MFDQMASGKLETECRYIVRGCCLENPELTLLLFLLGFIITAAAVLLLLLLPVLLLQLILILT